MARHPRRLRQRKPDAWHLQISDAEDHQDKLCSLHRTYNLDLASGPEEHTSTGKKETKVPEAWTLREAVDSDPAESSYKAQNTRRVTRVCSFEWHGRHRERKLCGGNVQQVPNDEEMMEQKISPRDQKSSCFPAVR